MSRSDMTKDPAAVASMFDSTASNYDVSNTILSLGIDHLWRFQMLRAVDVQPGERILDVAAGTGTSSLPMARKGALVTALDFSEGMIAEGRRRHPEIEFVHGSATELPFENETFDAVTISFGLRNVQDPRLALAEFYRVLKPGGRVRICEFSRPPVALVRDGYHAYLKLALPQLARLVSSNPEAYTYLTESIDQWPDQASVSRWIRGAGFTRVAHRNLSLGVVALHRGRKPTELTTPIPQVTQAAEDPSDSGSTS